MLLAIGMFVFEIPNVLFDQLKRRRSWRHPTSERVGARAASQFAGVGDDNLTITGGPSGIYGIPGVELFGLDLSSPVMFYFFCVVVVSLLVLGSARLGKSRLGRAWRFVREDEDAAEAMGIHTYKVKLAAYIFGAMWGGMGGMLFAAHLSAISPQSFVFLQSALVLMAVVLGGMGNTRGVVVGAVVISLLPEFLRDMGNLRYVIFGVVLIAVMVLRPQGFWPARAYEPEKDASDQDEPDQDDGGSGPGAHGRKRSRREHRKVASSGQERGENA